MIMLRFFKHKKSIDHILKEFDNFDPISVIRKMFVVRSENKRSRRSI